MEQIPPLAGTILTTLREKKKYAVHCIVGGASERYTADTLRAIGVTPVMTHDVREVDEFVDSSNAVLVQLSTQSEAKEKGILTAIETARCTAKPWIFSPKLANRSVFRRERARSLAEHRPKIVCGRPRELAAIVRSNKVDLQKFAAQHKTTALQIGARMDVVCSFRSIAIKNGSEYWDRVEAMDTALAALCAAFAAIEHDGHKVACAAALVAGIAAERASTGAGGPGSFAVNFLDEIAKLEPLDIIARADTEEQRSSIFA